MWVGMTAFFVLLIAIADGAVKDPMSRIILRLYLGWWGVSLVASTLDPIGLLPVSPYVYLLLLLSVAAYTGGYVAVGVGRPEPPESDRWTPLARSVHDLVETSRPVLVILIGLSLYLFRYLVRYLEVLASMGAAEARNIRFTIGPLFGSALEVLVFNYFAEAVAVSLLVIVAFGLVLGSVRNWVFAWACVDLVLFAGIGAGRTLFVQAGLFILLLAALRGHLQPRTPEAAPRADAPASSPPRKSLIATLILPGAVLTALMVYLTFARMFTLENAVELLREGDVVRYAWDSFVDNVESYSVGPFRALDHAVQHPSRYGVHAGRLTFGAVDEMIGYPLRQLGFDYPIANHIVGEVLQEPIQIGGMEFNALYTAPFRFYFDFGVVGVIALSFVFGAAVRGAVRWFQASPTAPTLAILLFLFGVSILSTQTWHLASPSSVVFLVGAALAQRATAR